MLLYPTSLKQSLVASIHSSVVVAYFISTKYFSRLSAQSTINTPLMCPPSSSSIQSEGAGSILEILNETWRVTSLFECVRNLNSYTAKANLKCFRLHIPSPKSRQGVFFEEVQIKFRDFYWNLWEATAKQIPSKILEDLAYRLLKRQRCDHATVREKKIYLMHISISLTVLWSFGYL